MHQGQDGVRRRQGKTRKDRARATESEGGKEVGRITVSRGRAKVKQVYKTAKIYDNFFTTLSLL